jgi:hypothetical protein
MDDQPLARIEQLARPNRLQCCGDCQKLGRRNPATHRVWAFMRCWTAGQADYSDRWHHHAFACHWHALVAARRLNRATMPR